MKMGRMRLAMEKEKQREENILKIFESRKIVVPDIDMESPGITELVR